MKAAPVPSIVPASQLPSATGNGRASAAADVPAHDASFASALQHAGGRPARRTASVKPERPSGGSAPPSGGNAMPPKPDAVPIGPHAKPLTPASSPSAESSGTSDAAVADAATELPSMLVPLTASTTPAVRPTAAGPGTSAVPATSAASPAILVPAGTNALSASPTSVAPMAMAGWAGAADEASGSTFADPASPNAPDPSASAAAASLARGSAASAQAAALPAASEATTDTGTPAAAALGRAAPATAKAGPPASVGGKNASTAAAGTAAFHDPLANLAPAAAVPASVTSPAAAASAATVCDDSPAAALDGATDSRPFKLPASPNAVAGDAPTAAASGAVAADSGDGNSASFGIVAAGSTVPVLAPGAATTALTDGGRHARFDAGAPDGAAATGSLPTAGNMDAAATVVSAAGGAAATSPAGSPAAATPSLPIHAALDSGEFPQELSQRVSWMVDNGVNGAKLQVNPPQLGPIELSISVQGDHAQVSMITHSAVTREALESSSPKLREMLGAQGFAAVSVDISQRSFQERSPYSPPYERVPAAAPTPVPTASTVAEAPRRSALGALDAYA